VLLVAELTPVRASHLPGLRTDEHILGQTMTQQVRSQLLKELAEHVNVRQENMNRVNKV